MKKANMRMMASLLSISSAVAALDFPIPSGIFPFMIPSVLPLDIRDDPITFRDGPDYYTQLEIQRRNQFYGAERENVEVENTKSYKPPTLQSYQDAKVTQSRNAVPNSRVGQNTQNGQTQTQRLQSNQIQRLGQNSQSDNQNSQADTQRQQSEFESSFQRDQEAQSLVPSSQSVLPGVRNAENKGQKVPINPFVSLSLNRPVHFPKDDAMPDNDVGMGLNPSQVSAGLVSPGNIEGIPVQQVSPAAASVTGFGFEIMKALEKNPGNMVASPYSIALILALLQQGTEGQSQIQITKALRMTPQQSKETFQRLTTDHKKRHSRNILRIGTNIFFSDTFDVNPQYKKDASYFFNSDVTTNNFGNPTAAAKEINRWVSGKTQGNIPYVISPDNLSNDTQMVLANAVYFKGLWNETFNKERTLSRPFYMADGTVKQANFMHHTGSFKAGRDFGLNADFLVMPFEGLQYSLISIVPFESTSVTTLLQQLSHEHLLDILSTPQREVVISLPKFKIRVDTDLKAPLHALGIRDIFTDNSGLAALGNTKGARPRVTSALHTAMLAIDEQGGSAAAATLLAVSTLSIDFMDLEFRFSADRPFVAVLWDNNQSVPLFMAKIEDPTREA